MSDGMRRELVYLSSHATNRYFIPNWGKIVQAKSRHALNGSSSWIVWNEVTNWSSRSSAMRCVAFGSWRCSWSFAG